MSDVQWSSFLVSELFDIFTGTDLILSRTNEGEIPVITHQEGNNGISMFAEELSRPLMDHRDTISLADRGTFKAYTQPADFYIGTRVKALKLRHRPVSENILLFLTTVINAQQKLFSYGYNATNNVGRIKIMLPIDDNGNPNWGYMDKYIENIKSKAKNIAINNFRKELDNIGCIERVSIKEIKWNNFSIESIATIKSGNDWTKSKRKPGKAPFIGASSTTNAITDFVDPSVKPNYVDKNVISINRNGSVGYAFYHPYEAYFSGDTRFIKLKEHSENEYINFFISRCITNQKDKYAYGYKMGTERIMRQKIALPVNDTGGIDYGFMENYIKQIKKDKIEKVLSFLENNLS